MKILYILGAFKPRASANGLCSENVLNQLVKDGNEVTVISNRLFDCPAFSRENGIEIYRIKPRFSYWLSDLAKTKNNAFLLKLSALINKAKLFFASSTWPFVSPLYTYRFYKQAKKLHKKAAFDVVISVYTPIDSMLAGFLLKRKFPEIKFVPYYLDALAGGWGPRSWSEEKKEKRTGRLEKMFAKSADRIISMESSRQHHEKKSETEAFNDKRVFLDVPLLCSNEENDEDISSQKNSRKTIVFAGGLPFPRRDPRPSLEILSIVCNKKDIDVVFAGECNKPGIFNEYIEKTDGKIKYLGYQEHEKIIKLEKDAACLLNIGSSNANTISGKIFEYMSFGKPIISTLPNDKEPSVEYLQKYNPVVFIDEKAEYQASAEKIIEFLDTEQEVVIGNRELKEIFYKNTPEAFSGVINEIIK